jgi:aldehyde dehydrogenase (NAD+)
MTALMLIDGELVAATGSAVYPNIDPTTEESIGTTADATPEDVSRAVGAARRAFDESDWANDAAFRRHCLEQLSTAMTATDEALRTVQTAEGGMPSCLAYTPTDFLAYWAKLATDYGYERNVSGEAALAGAGRRVMRREPIGVVAAITPWNFPMYLNIAKLGPALAAGNTLILKPAPDTPWCATRLGELIASRTDIPAGVVNVVTSSDPAAGAALTADPRVDMVSFTGSTATGRRVMAAGADTIKKVFLELGGKSAHVVLEDADFETVVPDAASAVCLHSGQGCAWLTRLLLPRSRYDDGVELAVKAMQSVRYGDPRDPSVTHGPVINAAQRDRVLGYIQRGVDEGARLVTGGKRPADLTSGYFIEPTLFADVDPESTIAQEEIFGPVLCVIPYDGDDDAVRIANATAYGLCGAVTSADEERAMRVARRLRTGVISVNGGACFGPDVPMGGYRQSGVGRENGIEGFEEYLEIKTLGLPAP